ncbi:MAG TPA: sugar ABC transporter ATP-binding protein, partial [Candidatus Sumerlaeota bacterium]|nr:sugar ABC transporter ATP-binding protein [Candidatus Sumerlaeota bacterium]
MAHVILKNVSKIFSGNVIAVDNISLEIKDKEFLVLVGPFGCG